jgi:hypothetical protein
MNAEQIIKEVLDGTFTRVTTEGNVITVNVDDDYIPNSSTGGKKIGETGGKYSQYSQKEDDILIELRQMGFPFPKIASYLNRTEDSLKKRHRTLCVTRGVKRVGHTNIK